MVDPVWPGCTHVSDGESRKWLTETQMANFAWSSQARGFFTDRAGPYKREDPSLVRCWYSDLNFRRRDRAIELAASKGVQPIAIAAAYVLCQPFASFALIGPRTLHELHTSLPALDVQLTPEELTWLACED
jgi:aryl-alcohol dehydrogenase-like predicted oxidoreductase